MCVERESCFLRNSDGQECILTVVQVREKRTVRNLTGDD